MNWERYHALVTLDNTGASAEALLGLQELLVDAKNEHERSAVLLAIGSCLRSLGRQAEAREALAHARQFAPEKSEGFAWVMFAETCLDKDEGRWNDALAKCETLLSKFSGLFQRSENRAQLEHLQRIRGMALSEVGRPAEALPLLSAPAACGADAGDALYYLARCQYDLGQFDRARQSFRKALDSELPSAYQPSAHYMLGLIYYGQGQYAWAIRELEWCLENDPSSRVPREYVLKNLVKASVALGLNGDAERYSEMLRNLN